MRQRFPNLKTMQPVSQTDETSRYPSEEVDRTRVLVTSIRHIVENVHAQMKTWHIQRRPLDRAYMDRHFLQHHRFINGLINRFGFNRRTGAVNPTMTAADRLECLLDNPLIIETDLSSRIFNQGELQWNRVNRSAWDEQTMDFGQLVSRFPTLTNFDLDCFTGGPYLRRKASAYVQLQKDYFEKRRNHLTSRQGGPSQLSTTTLNMVHLNTTYNFKVDMMKSPKLAVNMPELATLIRMDAGSFFSKWRRFKVFVGIENHPDTDNCRFTFGCTCSTGNRRTPCVHGVLVLTIFGKMRGEL